MNQKDSSGDMSTWERTARLMDSTGGFNENCTSPHFVGSEAWQICPGPRCLMAVGAMTVISVNQMFPSLETAMSSLYPWAHPSLWSSEPHSSHWAYAPI